MRLTTVILITSLMQVSASSLAQKINLSGSNIPLKTVLIQLGTQSGYNVVYPELTLKYAKPVNIDAVDANLEEVLEKLFKGLPFSYTINKNTIIIKEKDKTILDKLVTFFAAIEVRGRVVSENNLPLAGATVSILRAEGKTAAAITDANGEFHLKNVNEDAQIMISYTGYQNYVIKAQRNLGTLKMNVNAAALNEVTVSTGYQKIRRDQLTGSVSTVNEKQYQQRVAVTGNFLESLEGKVPGLVYNGQTGELSIRGISTFDAVKQPLIVLDGFPTEIDLRTINPNDIISVNVLRDAAAASIYGVRASNGVIIVETRRGKSGKPRFNLTSTYAVQNKPDFGYLKYAHASEFVEMQKAYYAAIPPSPFAYDTYNYAKDPAIAIILDGPLPGVLNPKLTKEQVDLKLAELGSYDNLKEYERLFYQTRQAKNVNLDVSGGSDKSTYMLGFNYIGETPVNRGSDNQQFMLNMANTFKFSERFNFDFKGIYTNSVNKRGTTPEYLSFYPYERLADENGNALPVALSPSRSPYGFAVNQKRNDALMAAGLYDQRYYPYYELTGNTNTSKMSAVKFQGRLNAKITDWVNLDLGGNYENQNITSDQLMDELSYSTKLLLNMTALKDATSGRGLFVNVPQGDILKQLIQKTTNYTVRAQLNFNHKIENDHDISGILGTEQRKTLSRGITTSLFGYDDQTLMSKPVNMGLITSGNRVAFSQVGGYSAPAFSNYFGNSEDDRRFISYYGQGTYVYQSKYVATGSFRIDKSNLFGTDPKYRNKPLWSAGVNWRLGKEDFLKDLNWVNELQLRASTGFNGNIPASNGGTYLLLNTGVNTSLVSPLTYYDIYSPENQSIRWETTRNYNVGLDYGLFDNRISGSVEWYMKTATDVFGQFDADPTSGFNNYNANTSSIRNKGLEFMVNSLNLTTSQFEWRTQLTASFNQNKVLNVKATEFSTSSQIVSGNAPVKDYPLGALFSYQYGGLNEIGQPYVYDNAGNKKVISNTIVGVVDVERKDLIYNGTTTPKYVLGLNNQFRIGSFDLSFLLMYYGGHVMRVEQPGVGLINGFRGNLLAGSLNYWKKPGDEKNTIIPGIPQSEWGSFTSDARYGYMYASQFVRKADYIRLRDVVLTYRAKMPFLEKIGMQNTQLRFQAQNAFRYTFSGNDIDPDAINRLTGVRLLENQPFYSLTFSTNF